MAGTSIEYNLDDIARQLEGVVEMPTALPKTIRDVSTYLSATVKRRFDTQTNPEGQRWAELKKPRSRRRDKRAKGGTGQKVLRDKGLLMASATGQPVEGAVVRTGPLSLEQGSNLAYAAIHNFGGTIDMPERRAPTKGGKKAWSWLGEDQVRRWATRIRAHQIVIPQRQFVGLNEADIDKIALITLDNILRGTP